MALKREGNQVEGDMVQPWMSLAKLVPIPGYSRHNVHPTILGVGGTGTVQETSSQKSQHLNPTSTIKLA